MQKLEPHIKLKMGEHFIGQSNEAIMSDGIGSCLMLLIFEPFLKIGGVAHCVLPEKTFKTSEKASSSYYVDEGIKLMVEQLEQLGCSKDRLIAKIVGGASVLREYTHLTLGERNIEMARKVLATYNIPIKGEDVGGIEGRSVMINMEIGTVTIQKRI